MTSRRRRDARPLPRRYRLVPRDIEILFAVGRMAEATTEQLRRLFFGDLSTASRRLAKLVALRLLDAHVGPLELPNSYTLGSKAKQILEAAGMSTIELHERRRWHGLDLHLREANNLRVELVLAMRGRTDVELEAFHGDLDLRRVAGSAPPAYIPDAVVELRIGDAPLVLLVEIDLGTEGLRVFSTKVMFTVALWRDGAKCWGASPGTWRPAVFVPTETRARALARTIASAGGDALWLIAEFQTLREQGALGAIFATAEEIVTTPRSNVIRYRGALAPAPTQSVLEGNRD